MPITIPQGFGNISSSEIGIGSVYRNILERPRRSRLRTVSKGKKKAEKPDTLCTRSKYWIEHWLGKSTKGMSCAQAIFIAKTYYEVGRKYGENPPKI